MVLFHWLIIQYNDQSCHMVLFHWLIIQYNDQSCHMVLFHWLIIQYNDHTDDSRKSLLMNTDVVKIVTL